MLRVFQIGFHISGTRSLCEFFKKNNFRGFHHENAELATQLINNLKDGKTHFDKKYEGPFKGKQGAFYSDMLGWNDIIYPWDIKEGYKLFKEIDNYYKNSFFILNTRENWIERKVDKAHKNGYFKRAKEHISEKEITDWWKKDQREHYNNVRNYFKERKEFIEFDIQKDNIDKLIKWIKINNVEIKHNKLSKLKG